MARLFDDGLDQYLHSATTPVVAAPLSISCWGYTDDLTIFETLFWLGNSSETDQYFLLSVRGDEAGDKLQYWVRGIGNAQASSVAAVPANTWFHAGAYTDSSDNHSVFLNGVEAHIVDPEVPDGVDSLAIGMARDSSPSVPWSGRIAEVGLWDVQLTVAEFAILAKGFSPLFVRPESLVAYWPLIRTDQDWAGGYNMTAYNSPTFGDHAPKVIYPVPAVARVSGRGVFVTHT